MPRTDSKNNGKSVEVAAEAAGTVERAVGPSVPHSTLARTLGVAVAAIVADERGAPRTLAAAPPPAESVPLQGLMTHTLLKRQIKELHRRQLRQYLYA